MLYNGCGSDAKASAAALYFQILREASALLVLFQWAIPGSGVWNGQTVLLSRFLFAVNYSGAGS
ncbi:MAG: hypothetical protein K2M07_06565 [Muribaculaceae bacterium]|nr:hypothetical protein [Muribaculaceae bacterium]